MQRSAQGLYIEQCPKHCSFFMRAMQRVCRAGVQPRSAYVKPLNFGPPLLLLIARGIARRRWCLCRSWAGVLNALTASTTCRAAAALGRRHARLGQDARGVCPRLLLHGRWWKRSRRSERLPKTDRGTIAAGRFPAQSKGAAGVRNSVVLRRPIGAVLLPCRPSALRA